MAAAIFVNAESLKKMKMTTGLDWSEVASLTADELITVFFYSFDNGLRYLMLPIAGEAWCAQHNLLCC